MNIAKLIFVLLSFALCSRCCVADKPVSNHAYVQSGPGGIFYARCIPAESTGVKGTTQVFKVERDGDKLVDSYSWYSVQPVVLGWSPITGKVAVMSMKEGLAEKGDGVQFSFHMGGKLLRAYTTDNLREMQFEILDNVKRNYPAYRVIGCEQIPRTNRYVFSITDNKDRKLSFDITTGELEPDSD